MALGAGGNLLLLFISPFCLPQIFGTQISVSPPSFFNAILSLGNDREWWSLPAFCLLLAMIHLFVANHFPESPKHLYISKNEREKSIASVIFYHGEGLDESIGMLFCSN